MITLQMSPAQMAVQMIKEIRQDMEAGLVPVTVTSFSALHDHVDANEYLINAMDAAGEEFDPADEAQAARDNRAMDMVNVWLAARP